FFLVGLSNVDADRVRNLQLLKERSWFDLPLVYANQRRAIIAIEKGAPGERAFNEAFAAWGEDSPPASAPSATNEAAQATKKKTYPGVAEAFRKALAYPSEPGTGSTWSLMFKSQVERCWKKPLYASEETSKPEAAFSIRLNPDGTLQGMPVPEKSPTTPFGRVYLESALRAII